MQYIVQLVQERLVPLIAKHTAFWLIAVLGVVFVFATSAFSFQLAPQVNSPDEAVNLAFIEQFSQTFSLQIKAGAASTAFDLAPRSVVFESGAYAPAAFIGMIVLYGLLAWILGSWFIWVATPLVAGAAGLALYSLISRTWGRPTAVVTGLLYFLHPVLWYYTVRGLYHNVLFLSLLIVGLWLVVIRPLKKQWTNDVFAFGVIGMSILVRGAELPWVAGLLVLIWVFTKGWKRLAQTGIWIGLGVVSAAVVSIAQPDLLLGGYVLGETSFTQLLFPFGIHPKLVWHNLWQYGLALGGVVGLFSVIGWLYAARHKRSSYFWIFTLLAWVPLVVYGSWQIADNPTSWLVTMGNSYMRYWLPVFIFALPFVGFAVTQMFDWLQQRDKRYAGGFWFAFFIFWVVGSVRLFYGGVDGYAAIAQQTEFADAVTVQVFATTQPNDVIFVNTWDKVFWPERTVARGLFTQDGAQTAGDTLMQFDESSVWYFGLKMDAEQEDFLRDNQAIISLIELEFGDHALYRLVFPPPYGQ